jgi:hypothetical protein
MAKQLGSVKINGTIDNLTFYRMNGKSLVRKKSSLDKKRLKRDLRFAATMKSAERLARASRIGSVIYRMFFRDTKNMKIYREITGRAIVMLKNGLAAGEVLEMLKKEYGPEIVSKSESQ